MIIIKTYCYSQHELPFVIATLTEGWSYIDKLVLYEYNVTHQGHEKSYEMEKCLHLIPENLRTKIDYKKIDLSEASVATMDSHTIHSVNEPIQRSIMFNDPDYNLSDDDIIVDCDIDEIIYADSWPSLLRELTDKNQPLSIRLHQFFYKHTYLWSECDFSSPTIYRYRMVKNISTRIKNMAIKNLRDLPTKTNSIYGCHMSWVMPVENMIKKLNSYGHPEYKKFANKEILEDAVNNKIYPFDMTRPFNLEELSITDRRIPKTLQVTNIFHHLYSNNR